MILSNDGLVAFHYRSYGTFFLQQNRLHNIHRALPTTNIIEPLIFDSFSTPKYKTTGDILLLGVTYPKDSIELIY